MRPVPAERTMGASGRGAPPLLFRRARKALVSTRRSRRADAPSAPPGAGRPQAVPGQTTLIRSLLVANRGEIALRVIRAARERGIRAIAVYSEPDRLAPHVLEANEAYPIGPAPPAESYLRADRLIRVAQEAGAEAIHPGYGFLAERADFARAVEDAGILFRRPVVRRDRRDGR